jgi:hypothetical protein
VLGGHQFRLSVEREVEHDGDAAEFAHFSTVVSLDGFNESFQQHAPKGFGPLDRQVTIDLLLVADDSSARRDEHMAQLNERVAAAETGITRRLPRCGGAAEEEGYTERGLDGAGETKKPLTLRSAAVCVRGGT